MRQVLGVDEGQLVGPDLLALLGVLDAYPPLSAHDLDHTFSSSDSSLDAYPSDSNAMGSR